MKKTALILILISLLSKPLGFVRQLLLSYFFGATNLTDAYFVATSVLGLVMIYFSAISISYIPTYNKILTNNGEKQANKFTNHLISIQLLGSIFVVFIILLLSDVVIYVLASGFDIHTAQLTKKMLIILTIAIPAMVVSNELSSFLNIKNKSVQRALALYSNHIIIIFVILAGYFSIYLLPIGGVVCSFILLLILMLLAYKQGLKLAFRPSFDENIRYALLFAIPMVLNNSLTLINKLVDQNIGSRLGDGIISAINYSAGLQSLLVDGVVGLLLINVVFPRLSLLFQQNKQEAIITYRKVLIILQVIVIPISMLFIFFANDIVSFIYGRGSFGLSAVEMTSTVLQIMAISFPFIVYNMLCNNMLFAFHLSKLPLIFSIVVVFTNVVFSISLSYLYGLEGLISGTVISFIFGACASAIIFKYKVAELELGVLVYKILKILIISSIVVLVTFKLRDFLHLYLSDNISVIVYILSASFLYLSLIQFIRIDEITMIRKLLIQNIKQKLRK